MNKQEIIEMLEAWNFEADAKKSVANRLESALTKTGSASSRLNMASASLAKLAETLDEETSSHSEALTMSAFLKFCSLVAVDNKKPATEKTKRENWHDTDSAEGKAILSGKKSRKTDSKKSDNQALIDALLDALTSASR